MDRSSLVVVRRRAPQGGAFRSPGYPVTTVLFVLLVVTIVLLVTISRPIEALAGFALVLIGVPVHTMVSRRHSVR
jgi:APA family basic amino acid/polyamine antiporter